VGCTSVSTKKRWEGGGAGLYDIFSLSKVMQLVAKIFFQII